jgi:hypothetical protein
MFHMVISEHLLRSEHIWGLLVLATKQADFILSEICFLHIFMKY